MKVVKPTEQNLGKKCTWCNQNHSSYECDIKDKVELKEIKIIGETGDSRLGGSHTENSLELPK